MSCGLFLAGLLACSRAYAAPQSAWEPAKTYVFAASIIEWPAQADLAPFKDARRDGDFIHQLEADGVPRDHVVFLADAQATRAAMRRELRALATRAGEGSTFVFYFQGHGFQVNGQTYFAPYDLNAQRPVQTAFGVAEIFPILQSAWKGDRLLLFGDCCQSGALANVVQQFDSRRVHVASIASATASNDSTGRWTFTEALLKAFGGEGFADRNRDGTIEFSEMDAFVRAEMKYREDQLTGSAHSSSFEAGFPIRAVAPGRALHRIEGPYEIGDFIEARDFKGDWYVSQILERRADDGSYRVHFCGWEDRWDEWVDPPGLRPVNRRKLLVGEKYEVEWQPNQWYLATVTKSLDDYFYFVHYEGENGEDDEWMTSNRARRPGRVAGRAVPEFVALAPRSLRVGSVVAARWRQEWYRARVTAIEGGVYSVRYDDDTGGKLAGDEMVPVALGNDIRVGERVLACWDGKPLMFAGRVAARDARGVTVRWEDGSAPTVVPFDQVARVR